jgi:hypothetical protein
MREECNVFDEEEDKEDEEEVQKKSTQGFYLKNMLR